MNNKTIFKLVRSCELAFISCVTGHRAHWSPGVRYSSRASVFSCSGLRRERRSTSGNYFFFTCSSETVCRQLSLKRAKKCAFGRLGWNAGCRFGDAICSCVSAVEIPRIHCVLATRPGANFSACAHVRHRVAGTQVVWS